jgi:hypothetical protein
MLKMLQDIQTLEAGYKLNRLVTNALHGPGMRTRAYSTDLWELENLKAAMTAKGFDFRVAADEDGSPMTSGTSGDDDPLFAGFVQSGESIGKAHFLSMGRNMGRYPLLLCRAALLALNEDEGTGG